MTALVIVLAGALAGTLVWSRYLRLQNADLRNEIADALAWIDPIQIERERDDGKI